MPGADGDDLSLVGWDVLVVGQSQAWPFVTFCAPTDLRSERTLWIDTDFTVSDPEGCHSSGTRLAQLEPLIALIVRGVTLREDALCVEFDDGSSLQVSNAPSGPDSQGWWIGHPGDG